MNCILVSIEFLKEPSRDSIRMFFSRVPCIGEDIAVGEECHTVHVVIHEAAAGAGKPAAILRVK